MILNISILLLSGFNKEELIENIKGGKNNAMKLLHQVNRSVRSEQRNLQEEALKKIQINNSIKKSIMGS